MKDFIAGQFLFDGKQLRAYVNKKNTKTEISENKFQCNALFILFQSSLIYFCKAIIDNVFKLYKFVHIRQIFNNISNELPSSTIE